MTVEYNSKYYKPTKKGYICNGCSLLGARCNKLGVKCTLSEKYQYKPVYVPSPENKIKCKEVT